MSIFCVIFTAQLKPSFAEHVPNVTVTAGKDALLPCVVDNLGHFKVTIDFLYAKKKMNQVTRVMQPF